MIMRAYMFAYYDNRYQLDDGGDHPEDGGTWQLCKFVACDHWYSIGIRLGGEELVGEPAPTPEDELIRKACQLWIQTLQDMSFKTYIEKTLPFTRCVDLSR